MQLGLYLIGSLSYRYISNISNLVVSHLMSVAIRYQMQSAASLNLLQCAQKRRMEKDGEDTRKKI